MLYVNPAASLHAVRGEALSQPEAKERLALEEFEHFFVFTLLQEMRKTIPKGGLLDGGMAEEMQDELLDDALSREIAASGQFGVAGLIEEQLRLGEMQKRFQAGDLASGTLTE